MPEVTLAKVVQLRVNGSYITEEFVNVFYYATDDFIDPMGDFLLAWKTKFEGLFPPIMSTSTAIRLLEGTQVKGGNAFDSFVTEIDGAISGDGMPPYVSWDFTLLRGGAGERNGYKRIAGVPESKVDFGRAVSGVLSDLNALAAAMADTVGTTNDTWVPCIRRTRINHVTQTPPKYYSISDVKYSRVGTQNSRKFGHGR